MKGFHCFTIGASLILAACGGGGGGGGGGSSGGTSATLGTFTKFSDIPANTPTRISGYSQEVTYNHSGATVTSVSSLTGFSQTATADFTLDSSRNPTSIDFTSAQGTTASFKTSRGDTIGILSADNGIGVAGTSAGDKVALFARSEYNGWDYQTFGIWMTGLNSSSGTAGSFAVGSLTSSSAIPTSGTGTYTGKSMGLYVDPSNNAYLTIANLSAATDFAARTISFSTTGTQQTALSSTPTGTYSANSNLNLSGTLTYSSGSNQFLGSVTTVGGGTGNAAMTGTATGNFYGPAAQEIAGSFVTSGGSGSSNSFMGAFGGKK